MRSFIHALPKVELHVHLVGSAGLDTVLELARRHPEAGVPADRDELERFYTFRDFDHFLKVYWAVQSMLKDRDDIHPLVVGLARELARQNVRYAEVTVTPYNHLLDGMCGDELLAGLASGRAEALAVASALDLGFAEVARLAENAVLASFLPNRRRTSLLEEISGVLASV